MKSLGFSRAVRIFGKACRRRKTNLRKSKSVFLAFILALLPVAVYGEEPSGHYETSFTSGNQKIWDLSGSYTYTAADSDEVTEFTLLQDNKGKLTGHGSASGTEHGVAVDLTFTLSGTVSSKNTITRVSLAMKIDGTASNGFFVAPVTGSLKYTLDVDNASHLLIGAVKGKVCIKAKGAGCAAVNETAELVIPEGTDEFWNDGSWRLVMDVQTINGKKVIGNAAAVLVSGRTFPFQVGGSYNAKTDLAKLNLKVSGGTLTLEAKLVSGLILSPKGTAKLLGQSADLGCNLSTVWCARYGVIDPSATTPRL